MRRLHRGFPPNKACPNSPIPHSGEPRASEVMNRVDQHGVVYTLSRPHRQDSVKTAYVHHVCLNYRWGPLLDSRSDKREWWIRLRLCCRNANMFLPVSRCLLMSHNKKLKLGSSFSKDFQQSSIAKRASRDDGKV